MIIVPRNSEPSEEELIFESLDDLPSFNDFNYDLRILNPGIIDHINQSTFTPYFYVKSNLVLKSNKTICDCYNRINDWEISGAKITIKDVTMPATMLMAGTEFKVINPYHSARYKFTNSIPVQDGTVIIFPEEFLHSLERVLKDKSDFTFVLYGEMNNVSTIVLESVIDVTITADEL